MTKVDILNVYMYQSPERTKSLIEIYIYDKRSCGSHKCKVL